MSDAVTMTKSKFSEYRDVQDSALYNMYTPEAVRETGLDKETYFTIIKNYSALKEKYEESKETD